MEIALMAASGGASKAVTGPAKAAAKAAAKKCLTQTLKTATKESFEKVVRKSAKELAEQEATAPMLIRLAIGAMPELLTNAVRLSEAAAREARRLGVDPAERALTCQAIARSMAALGCEPALVRSLDHLADAEVDAVLVLARGGRRMRDAVPDLVSRSRLANQGGIPAVSALGLSDSIPVDDFIKLDALASAGKVPATIGGKPTLARLGELLGNTAGAFPNSTVDISGAERPSGSPEEP